MVLRVWLLKTSVRATGGGGRLVVMWMRKRGCLASHPDTRTVVYAMCDLPDFYDANQGQTLPPGG